MFSTLRGITPIIKFTINTSKPFSANLAHTITPGLIRPRTPYVPLQRYQGSLQALEDTALRVEQGEEKKRGKNMPKAGYYAVRTGRNPGIYDTWAECESQTKGHAGAIYKKFPTRTGAEEFIGRTSVASQPYTASGVSSSEPRPAKKSSKGYYAVKSGLKPGIYQNWSQVEPLVKGIQGAVYKRFPTRNAAQEYMSGSGASNVEIVNDSFESEIANDSFKSTWTATIAHDPTSEDLNHHRQVARSQGFTITNGPTGALVVYTDGSSRGNGQLGATAGSGIWWADKGHARTLNLAERLPGSLQTNNRGELLAIIRALESCPFPQLPLEIRTDSQYSISCTCNDLDSNIQVLISRPLLRIVLISVLPSGMTKFLPGWIRNNFRSATGQPVKNQDMIVHLLALLNQRGKENGVRFVHVRAHRGEVGNEGADMLANAGAARSTVPERTDWFTMEDANRFTAQKQHETEQAGLDAFSTQRKNKTAPADDVQIPESGLATLDKLPVEIEVDPSWLLTEEEMSALDADQ